MQLCTLSLGAHISKTTIHILHALVLLDVLAEGTVTFLNVGELILILQEELAATFAHSDRHVGYHILKESARMVGTLLRVVYDEDLFEAHVLQNSLVHHDGLTVLRVHLLIQLLEHALCEHVVLNLVIINVLLEV